MLVPYTIEDTHERVLEMLDDESGERFARAFGSNTEDFTKMNRVIRSQVSGGLDDYVAEGGDRFDEEITDTTSATDGTLAMAGDRVRHIRSVRVDTGVSTYAIAEGDKHRGGAPDLQERTIDMTVVRHFELPAVPADDDLLLGTVAGAARSWDAFDEWICARVATAMSVKDAKLNAVAREHLQRAEKSVMQHKRTPSSKPWPEKEHASGLIAASLRWLWFPHEQTLQLMQGARS